MQATKTKTTEPVCDLKLISNLGSKFKNVGAFSLVKESRMHTLTQEHLSNRELISWFFPKCVIQNNKCIIESNFNPVYTSPLGTNKSPIELFLSQKLYGKLNT